MFWKTSPKSVEFIFQEIKFLKKHYNHSCHSWEQEFTIPTYGYRWKKKAQPKPICLSQVSINDKIKIIQKLKETSLQCYLCIEEIENKTNNNKYYKKSHEQIWHVIFNIIPMCTNTYLNTTALQIMQLTELEEKYDISSPTIKPILKEWYVSHNLNPFSECESPFDLFRLYYMYIQQFLNNETLKNIQSLLEEFGAFTPCHDKDLHFIHFSDWRVSIFPPGRVFLGSNKEEKDNDPAWNPLWYILSILHDFGKVFYLKESFDKLNEQHTSFLNKLKKINPQKDWSQQFYEKYAMEYLEREYIFNVIKKILNPKLKIIQPDMSIDNNQQDNELSISNFHVISESGQPFTSTFKKTSLDTINILWSWVIESFVSLEGLRFCKKCQRLFIQKHKVKPMKFCSAECKNRDGAKSYYARKKYKKKGL